MVRHYKRCDNTWSLRRKQVNFLVYRQDSKKTPVDRSAQWKWYYLILRVGIFSKIIFCISNTKEKPVIDNYYNNNKCLSYFWSFIWVYYVSRLILFQKGENSRLKKASWPKFCNIIFLFLLKIGSVGWARKPKN